MLQSRSNYKEPANGAADNGEILTFETENHTRKYRLLIADRFPNSSHELLVAKMPIQDIIINYKGMVFADQCEARNQNPFKTPFTNLFESVAMKALFKSFEKVGLNVLSKFNSEIRRIYMNLRAIIVETKVAEQECVTVREMLHFMMTENTQGAKVFKERLSVFEKEVDVAYNIVLEKLKAISGEWEELPKLKVSEEERDILRQQLAEKQKAFEYLFMRSVAFRSSAKMLKDDIAEEGKSDWVVQPLKVREFPTITIVPEYNSLSSKVSECYEKSKTMFKPTRDGLLTQTTAQRLIEDITVLSTAQLNFTTKILCLSKRACLAEHAKKTELQNLYKLHSNVVAKDNIVVKCTTDLDKLEWQLADHKAELDECMVSKFDDVIEIKQPSTSG